MKDGGSDGGGGRWEGGREGRRQLWSDCIIGDPSEAGRGQQTSNE